ncbi:MAG: hypothetical protein U9Q96_00430 [Patescibacteria group bacterium]|nr:hypothetical protein [Patescibacteria group bacterium]
MLCKECVGVGLVFLFPNETDSTSLKERIQSFLAELSVGNLSFVEIERAEADGISATFNCPVSSLEVYLRDIEEDLGFVAGEKIDTGPRVHYDLTVV